MSQSPALILTTTLKPTKRKCTRKQNTINKKQADTMYISIYNKTPTSYSVPEKKRPKVFST